MLAKLVSTVTPAYFRNSSRLRFVNTIEVASQSINPRPDAQSFSLLVSTTAMGVKVAIIMLVFGERMELDLWLSRVLGDRLIPVLVLVVERLLCHTIRSVMIRKGYQREIERKDEQRKEKEKE